MPPESMLMLNYRNHPILTCLQVTSSSSKHTFNTRGVEAYLTNHVVLCFVNYSVPLLKSNWLVDFFQHKQPAQNMQSHCINCLINDLGMDSYKQWFILKCPIVRHQKSKQNKLRKAVLYNSSFNSMMMMNWPLKAQEGQVVPIKNCNGKSYDLF